MECKSCGWQPAESINPPNVKEIGEFRVAKHNMVALADLKFERVVRCERQVVATDSRAISKNYEAVVWEKLCTLERQAISWAYRIGQNRVLDAYHLITYCKQVEKDPLSELVFSSTNKENDKRKSSAVVSEANILDEMEWQ
ncbi:snf2 domain-containing protein classy 4 [Quercus suber]|uniref:Snf2 domain-containing protein classy 4 n=1 Tax=Quercus suber TaxID=58331 RepID=A0AAW0M7J5_QUESU